MKKYLIMGIIVVVLMMPIAGASHIMSKNKVEIVTPTQTSKDDFTHAVLAEYGTMTTCPYCPAASSQLYAIYNSEDYDFYFVSMVWDVNSLQVGNRLQELGISSVPDVYFDGKYTHISGEQPNDQPYRNAIVQVGERTVPDIDIDVDVEWKGNSILKISVTVQNNEPDEYSGHLRVYIVEPESRWDDYSGDPYHFGVLDIPIDRNLAMVQGQPCPVGDTYTFTKTWIGALYGFGDITQDNTMVIASVFDKDTDYAVQTASAVPTGSGGQSIPQSGSQQSSTTLFFKILERLLNIE
jgi:hypothetical protein